jgi:hypothetical protein
MAKGGWLLVLLLLPAASGAAQTVLFDGVVHDDRQAVALLIPTAVTKDDYAFGGRLEYGWADLFNLFGLVGGMFNGGSKALAGAGWAATFYRQSDEFPLNLGFFNSYVFPLPSDRGPTAFLTVAPVFSHSWTHKGGSRVTPYVGATATFAVGGAPRGIPTDVNGLLGVKWTEIASYWDFIAEVQPGERTQFSFGLFYRF